MEKAKKIPTKIESFEEGKAPEMVVSDEGLTYEPRKGEVVDVMYWVRYPSYDFIFGVPAKESKYYEKEVGFFQLRNTKAKRVMVGVYVDCNELEELAYGFKKIVNISKLNRPEIWQSYQKRKVQETSVPIPKSSTPTATQMPKE